MDPAVDITELYAAHRLQLVRLAALLVNTSRSALRRRRTARAYTPPHDLSPPSPEDSAVLAEEHRAVIAALQTLAPRQREVLVLRYWSHFPTGTVCFDYVDDPDTARSR